MKIISKKQAKRILDKDEKRAQGHKKNYRWFESLHTDLHGRTTPCLRRFSDRSRKRNQLYLVV